MLKKFGFSETQYNNLLIFMQRISLTGEEVPSYNGIVQVLNNPIQDVPIEQQVEGLPDEFFKKALQNRGYKVDLEKIKAEPKTTEDTIPKKPKKKK